MARFMLKRLFQPLLQLHFIRSHKLLAHLSFHMLSQSPSTSPHLRGAAEDLEGWHGIDARCVRDLLKRDGLLDKLPGGSAAT